MDTEIDAEDRPFAGEVRTWLEEHLVGEFARLRGVGGPDDAEAWDVRLRWEKELSAGGWLGLTWPAEYGGRGATLAQAIIFEYEYARARAPYRVGVQGHDLFGPTLLQFGTDEQKSRFRPHGFRPVSLLGIAGAHLPEHLLERARPVGKIEAKALLGVEDSDPV